MIEELKTIDVNKYEITETGQVLKVSEEEKQRGLELQSYIDSIRDMTIKEIAIKHLKKHHLPKFLAGLLVKFSAPLLMAKDYELLELEKENKTLRIHQTNAVLEGLELEVLKNSHRDRANNLQERLTKAKAIMNIAVEGIKYWGIVGGTERPFTVQAEKLFNLFLDEVEKFNKEE